MRSLFLGLVAYAALIVSSFAQPPVEITGADTIRLQPGQSRVLEFDQSVGTIHLADDDVVEVLPGQTDRAFTFRALKSGTTIMTAYTPDGRLLHRSKVTVAGTLVKIYGAGTADEKKSDYVGYICTEFGCGRADPEIEKKPTTSTVTRRTRNGNIITTTTP